MDVREYTVGVLQNTKTFNTVILFNVYMHILHPKPKPIDIPILP